MLTHFDKPDHHNRNMKTALKHRFLEMLWWEPEQDSLPVQFSLETSLHGLKYIGQPKRHLIERIVWVSAFITGIIVALILINGVWEKYKANPVIVSFQNKETRIEQIPFPAITICNVNNVLRSKAQSFIKVALEEEEKSEASLEALKNIFYLNHICNDMALSFSQKFGFNTKGSTVPPELLEKYEALTHEEEFDNGKHYTDVKLFLQKNSQSCSDMIHLCLWQDDKENCVEMFQPLVWDVGKCCTFNMSPNSLLHTFTNDTRDNATLIEEWSKTGFFVANLLAETTGMNLPKFPRRSKQAGRTYGLSFLLNPNLDEYFCAAADGTGFKVVTHLPTSVPHIIDYGIAIQFNREVHISISPEITVSDKTIVNFPKEKRHCYYKEEFRLKYYAYYTESNCIDECVANLTFARCGCVRYFMPTDGERSLCTPSKLTCIDGIKESLARDGLAGDCKICMPTCWDINYVTTTSTSPVRNDAEIWVQKDGNISDWARSNVSIVHVYFSKASTYARIRKELYGFTDLIANTGGLLGLCLGFSALSALELLYFLTLRAWFLFHPEKNILENPKKMKARNRVMFLEDGGMIEDVVYPVPLVNDSSPYSQFIISELFTYYNKKRKSGVH